MRPPKNNGLDETKRIMSGAEDLHERSRRRMPITEMITTSRDEKDLLKTIRDERIGADTRVGTFAIQANVAVVTTGITMMKEIRENQATVNHNLRLSKMKIENARRIVQNQILVFETKRRHIDKLSKTGGLGVDRAVAAIHERSIKQLKESLRVLIDSDLS